jgi:hypothetical protein
MILDLPSIIGYGMILFWQLLRDPAAVTCFVCKQAGSPQKDESLRGGEPSPACIFLALAAGAQGDGKEPFR